MTKPVYVKGISIGDGIPKICVPVMGESFDKLCQDVKAAKKAGADLIEWRADFYQDIFQPDAIKNVLDSIEKILETIPLIFTIRSKKEGGNLDISEKKYMELLLQAAKTRKADLIDVEILRAPKEFSDLIEKIQKEQTLVIASSHDFEKTDSKEVLIKRFQQMEKSGADILKIAVMPKEAEDVAAIMQATYEMAKVYTEKPLISMAMGNKGSISRIAGENFGSSITFASVGQSSAPGQFPIEDLRIMMEALHKKNMEDE